MSDPIARGRQAESELRIVDEAFASARANALEQIAASRSGDSELREGLYRAVQALDMVRAHLRSIIDTGTMESVAAEYRDKTEG